MLRISGLIALLACLAMPTLAHTQTPDADRLADSVRTVIEGAANLGDAKRLEEAIALADRALAIFPQAPLLQHYRAYALYRAASIAIGRGRNGDARPYLEQARTLLESLTQHATIPESYALLASVYGLQIAASRFAMMAGMQLGPKSKEWMDRAIAAAPDNPRVRLLQGIGDFNTPSTFGGGLDQAEQHLKQAITFFANDHPTPPLPAWGLADAHVWLGQVYAKQKKREAARAEYTAALALQPQNQWITMVLIPALDKIRP